MPPRTDLMKLSEIVPVGPIEEKLGQPLRVERLDDSDWRKLLHRDPEDLFGIAALSWHRVVQSGRPKVKPMMMRKYFESTDPQLAAAIERLIKKPLFREFGFMEATIYHKGESFVVATSCAAHLFTGELHLYDIFVADPRHPIPEPKRKSYSQEYRGFGLLPTIMASVKQCAEERGCDTVSLTAAHRPLVAVFQRHGYGVEPGKAGEQALRLGLGIPMVMRLSGKN